MIKKTRELDEFYRRLAAQENLSHEEALRVFEGLYAEAVSLGAISEANVLEGLEADLRLAKALNGLRS